MNNKNEEKQIPENVVAQEQALPEDFENISFTQEEFFKLCSEADREYGMNDAPKAWEEEYDEAKARKQYRDLCCRDDDDWDPQYYRRWDDYDESESRFYEFAGTYAQDVAGLDDDFINDVLEGEPDAYWNID